MIARRIMLTERNPEPPTPRGGCPVRSFRRCSWPKASHDHVLAKNELRPAAVYHQTEDALDMGRIADALRDTAEVLNHLSSASPWPPKSGACSTRHRPRSTSPKPQPTKTDLPDAGRPRLPGWHRQAARSTPRSKCASTGGATAVSLPGRPLG